MQFLHQEAEFFMFPGVTKNNVSPHIFYCIEWQTRYLLKLSLKVPKSSKLFFSSVELRIKNQLKLRL